MHLNRTLGTIHFSPSAFSLDNCDSMSRTLRTLVLTASYLLGSCAFYTPSEPSEQELQALADFQQVQQLHEAFLELPDGLPRLEDMQTYAVDATRLYKTDSLRKAPIGSALLSKYQGSLIGHAVLEDFYVEYDESAANHHRKWVDKLINHVTFDRDGTPDRPYRTLTIFDAQAFVLNQGNAVIGSMYGTHNEYELIAYIVAKNPEGIVSKVYFEILAYPRLREITQDPNKDSPIDVIRVLAGKHNQSAKIAYGTYLLENANTDPKRSEQIVSAGKSWLRQSLSPPTAIAPYFLANFQVLNRHQGIRWDEVKALYERSIQLGYTDANVQLGKLYLSNVFGANERRQGLELIEQAAALDNVDAASTLGALLLASDPTDAIGYMRKAAELGTDREKLNYLRLVLHPDHERQLDNTAYSWTESLASDGNQEAMIRLAKVHAKGLYDEKVSFRKAKRWYQRSVEVKPDDGHNVNEVAWVFATTNLKRLRNPQLAIKYMDSLMSSNQQARQIPAYIDTWAAAYAAAGDFTRAIELQKEALQLAEHNQEDAAVANQLKSHLGYFEQQKALSEEVP